MEKEIFVIAKKYSFNKTNCDFVSKLSHHFAGEDEVLSFTELDRALSFETKEEAENVLLSQPEWVKRDCKVLRAFEAPWGERRLVRTSY